MTTKAGATTEAAAVSDEEASVRARVLAAALEPVVGSVYFAPECHEAYAALGFDPSPGSPTDPWGAAHWGRVAMTDGAAYFTSRGSLLGQVPGEVVAATFGVFNPVAVVALVDHGWSLTDAATIRAARTKGATAQLVRILGERPEGVERATELLARAGERLRPEGRPIYAGLLAVGVPPEPVGAAWHLAERLREYRGDAHVVAFTAAGFDGTEIQLLTEAVAGMPRGTYARTRAWSDQDLDEAEARLTERGLLAGGAPTEHGRAAREEVERATDAPCRPMVESLGDDLAELLAILRPWDEAVRAAAGYYPSSPQEALLSEEAQAWMDRHGLPRFGTQLGSGHGAGPAPGADARPDVVP